MTLLALFLVLTSASLHALWNLLAKQVSGGLIFVWLISALGTVLLFPIMVIEAINAHFQLTLTGVLFLAGTSVLHIGYYVALNRGYQVGDLSLVYPLARGTGPLLSTFGAILFLGEHPSVLVLLGSVLVTIGIFALTGDPRKLRQAGISPAVAYGLFTGGVIAIYTIWDNQTLKAGHITPLMLVWVSSLVRAVIFTPYARQHWTEIREMWTAHRRSVLGVSILDPLSYILYLTAQVASPVNAVSYLAPTRQISILIAALIGTRFLSEGQTVRRLAAVSAMMVGVMILILS